MNDLKLRIEELEERIAPTILGHPIQSTVPAGNDASPVQIAGNPSQSATPEVPAGANPQPHGHGGWGNPSTSATPEVPAGANPQPNGQGGSMGNPSTSANPEVPAGASPQPNPMRH